MADLPTPVPVLDYRSPAPRISKPERWSPLAWAAFLGASWTWCIGMFLPVLLIRDYGAIGWIVFAVPNVIGAAAMGWILRANESSERIVHAHRLTAHAFSVITVAFHCFFAAWLIRAWWGETVTWLLPVLVLVTFTFVQGVSFADRVVATLALLVSLLIVLYRPYDVGPYTVGRSDLSGLLWLTPVCVFGFALCPYLDLTFHRARRAGGSDDAHFAFGAGFGVCFLAMILLTPVYAVPMCHVLKNGYFLGDESFINAVGVHLTLQSAVTIAFHLRELAARDVRARDRRVLGAAVLVSILAGVVGIWARYPITWRGLNSGELIYRLFMAFYGLVFPAYVWLCMIPGRGRVAPDRKQIMVWLVSISVAAPAFWMGFIERRMIWLLPGLGVVLLARLLIQSRKTLSVSSGSGN